MHPQIALLLDLQDIDQRLSELQGQLNRYPVVWEDMKRKLQKKSAVYDAAEAELTSREEEKKRIEADLRGGSEKMKQYQAQQMMVKTAKELTAISNQIENMKKAVVRLEERGEEILSTEVELSERIKAASEELTAIKERARKERQRIRDQVAEKKKEMAALEADRKKVSARIEEAPRDLYEKTRKRWPEDPVVLVRSGSCTGCHFAILPNRLVDLHLEESILRCDHCGRILSHDETFVPVTQTS